ncbi:TOTE conflict system archaeo-eukaryotic primase domain-containing protein [Acidicapsa ligni]|uniref:TOTE conflict system archaeo-eukaryotic primase domain-containing protein n=1 Tax=Acidicapsa ligni TaxID=542300 RepID=UPI0021E09ABD|nr:hypothetical protein [Acidicapsa ligni]
MPTHFCVSRQTAEDFMRLFVNRLAYCIQREKTPSDGSAPYIKQKRPLDLGAVRMHLNGDATISLYAINPNTQRCKWVAIDADFDGAVDALFQLRHELKQDGIEAAPEQSRRGGHLWIFAEEPLLASLCRIYIYNAALRLGVPVKGGGLKEGIEVFPRQDQIADGAYGNAIRAPLGVHRKSNRRYWFYDADVTPEAQLAYLQGLKKLTATQLETLTQGMKLPEAYRPPEPVPFVPRTPILGQREFRILDYVQTTGKQDSRNWKAQCPSCGEAGRDRSRNNLGIKISDPRFYVCRAGCTKEEIRAALGQPIRKAAMA